MTESQESTQQHPDQQNTNQQNENNCGRGRGGSKQKPDVEINQSNAI